MYVYPRDSRRAREATSVHLGLHLDDGLYFLLYHTGWMRTCRARRAPILLNVGGVLNYCSGSCIRRRPCVLDTFQLPRQ